MLRLIAALFLAFLPAIAAAEQTPDALVKSVTDDVLAIVRTDKDIQSGNPAKVVQLAEEKVLPHFDFTRMTRLAVGRNWRQATDAQKQELTNQFRTLLVRTYSTSLHQYRNQTIQVKPLKASPQDTEVVVKTVVIQQGGPQIPIDYAMEKKPDGWKVYDVIIDGASLVTTYRGSFNEEIQRGGIDGLVKVLQQRNQAPVAARTATK